MFDTYFTKLFKGQEGKVKTELTNFVSTNLSLPSGVKSYFEDKMNSVSDADVASLFTDSNKISDILVDAIVDESKDSGSEPSDIMGAVQNVITSNMDSQETRYKIKKLIEKLMDERKSKIESMVKEIMSQVAKKTKDTNKNF
jgi:gas vesicle protein